MNDEERLRLTGWCRKKIEDQTRLCAEYNSEIIICEPQYFDFQKKIAWEVMIKKYGKDVAERMVREYPYQETAYRRFMEQAKRKILSGNSDMAHRP